MWHRRERKKVGSDRAGASDPVSSAIWETGHLTGASSEAPVIKAPRAADLASGTAA